MILWGERLGAAGAAQLLRIAEALGLAGRDGAGLIEIPSSRQRPRAARGRRRCPRPARATPTPPATGPRPPRRSRPRPPGARSRRCTCSSSTRSATSPIARTWERALHRAALVVAHASVLTEGLAEHASVIFPAESHAEKEGTVVHPDGRLQRLRVAISHPGEVRASWSVLAEIAKRCGLDTGALTSSMVFAQLARRGPGLPGHHARGDRRARAALAGTRTPSARCPPETLRPPAARPRHPGATNPCGSRTAALRLGTYRSIWASPQVEVSPALHYTIAEQLVELAPEDAARLGIGPGEAVEVAQNGTRLRGRAHVRTGVPAGTAFLADGLAADSANALTEPLIEVRKA